MNTKIAIHQPYYLPWSGFFHKIVNCDIFVINDAIEYSKKDFTRRAKIDTEAYLDVPLAQHSDFEKIVNLSVRDENWRHKHINKIINLYRNHPFFFDYIEHVEYFILRTKFLTNLAEINIQILNDVLNFLNITRKIERTCNYDISGQKEEYVINIVKHFGGDIYISGAGAKSYQQNENFEKNNIKLVYQDMYHYLQQNPYKQKGKQFVNGLTFIDALFNIGKEGFMKLIEDYRLDY